MNRILKIALIVVLVALLLGALGFVGWGLTPQSATADGVAAVNSDSQVKVETSPWYSFRPTTGQPTTGLIIYPGGHVDPRAYAPLAKAIAEQGYFVAITPMPLALAFLDGNQAAEVIKANPDIKHWAIAGHSLGGVAAASFAKNNPDKIKGLALWASYPQDADNLSNTGLNVHSIYGTADGLSTGAKIDASRKLLPADTEFVAIQGGNHGQFGSYGIQSGDGTATISREEQQKQIAEATVKLLNEITNQ